MKKRKSLLSECKEEKERHCHWECQSKKRKRWFESIVRRWSRVIVVIKWNSRRSQSRGIRSKSRIWCVIIICRNSEDVDVNLLTCLAVTRDTTEEEVMTMILYYYAVIPCAECCQWGRTIAWFVHRMRHSHHIVELRVVLEYWYNNNNTHSSSFITTNTNYYYY